MGKNKIPRRPGSGLLINQERAREGRNLLSSIHPSQKRAHRLPMFHSPLFPLHVIGSQPLAFLVVSQESNMIACELGCNAVPPIPYLEQIETRLSLGLFLICPTHTHRRAYTWLFSFFFFSFRLGIVDVVRGQDEFVVN